jgi:hypothetical protein
VPKGDYRLDVHTCLASVNGPDIDWGNYEIDEGKPGATRARQRGGPLVSEPIGAWFRRTRPGTPLPVWLRLHCSGDPRADPGHEAEYDGLDYDHEAQKLGSIVDFILQLTPADKAPSVPTRRPFNADGYVPLLRTYSLPRHCPVGLIARIPPRRTQKPATPNLTLPEWADGLHLQTDHGAYLHPRLTPAIEQRHNEMAGWWPKLWQKRVSGFSDGGVVCHESDPDVEHHFAYSHKLGFWAGVFMAGRLHHWLLAALFADGSILISTTEPGFQPDLKQRLYGASHADLAPDDLAVEHQNCVRQLEGTKGPVALVRPDEDFAPAATYARLLEHLHALRGGLA